MSTKLTVELPPHVAIAITQGDCERSQIAQCFVDAVKRLPPKETAIHVHDYTDSETVFTDTGLSTPPTGSEVETLTMVDSNSLRETGEQVDPDPSPETFFVDVEHQTAYQQTQIFTIPARSDMTVYELQAWLKRETGISEPQQRLLLHGRCLDSEVRLQEVSIGIVGQRREADFNSMALVQPHDCDYFASWASVSIVPTLTLCFVV